MFPRRLSLLLLGICAATSDPLAANGFSWNGQLTCGGNAFSTCATVWVTTSYDVNTGQTLVTMVVQNQSGAQRSYGATVFTQVGLWNMPQGTPGRRGTPGPQYVAGSLNVTDGSGQNVTGNWQLGTNGLSGTGIQQGVFGADAVHGINGGIGAGQTFTFTFRVTGLGSTFDVNSAGWATHGQGGPQDCSTKLVVNGGTANAGPYSTACSVGVVPEPVTMTLLATGLVGMGGAAAVRRRRQRQPG